jgi:hypothetical protein
VVSRASIQIEKLGLPAAPIVCTGFEKQGEETTKGFGVPGGLPFVIYPTHVNAHTNEELIETSKTTITDQIVQALTVQPREEPLPPEWDIGQTMFKGTLEEVNEFFYRNGWSDGLPIVPPTLDRVKAFLKYTDHDPADVIGVIKPDHRQATVWSIAVNGVMSGCRPEYLPVLIALVEAMADPRFFVENLGNTPGPETLIIINGPIIKELEFNYLQGATRTGFIANTSIGRFWRLFYRNVGGMLLHKTDKGTFGGNFRIVLAENEDFIEKIGWLPLSADFGFKRGDNVVTIAACPSCQVMPQIPVASDTLDRGLKQLAREVTSEVTWTYTMNYRGVSTRPIIVLSPQIAGPLAKAGYSKADLKKYFYDHTRRPAVDMPDAYDWVQKGLLPKEYGESTDPRRLIPITLSPDDFLIAVSGDPDRNNAMICDQNGVHGWPVSRKITLPPDWDELLKKAKAERNALLEKMVVIPSN